MFASLFCISSTNSVAKLNKCTVYFVVDECQKQGDLCPNGRCINVPSGFRCVCNQGYILGRDNKCLGKFDLLQSFSRLFLFPAKIASGGASSI